MERIPQNSLLKETITKQSLHHSNIIPSKIGHNLFFHSILGKKKVGVGYTLWANRTTCKHQNETKINVRLLFTRFLWIPLISDPAFSANKFKLKEF